MSSIIFALDIGTQSVSGILLEQNGKQFNIVDYHTEQHKERSMLDGQIQQVVEVANVIQTVKTTLEEKHGPLQNVCVAAAGRALKTVKAKKSISITNQPLVSKEAIHHLELGAVQQAQLELNETKVKTSSSYHCVGFSVLHYYLDGEPIGSLIDQPGKEASAEVITTFLPKVVIESLLAALERANLTMQALTLEPIAATHVLVPPSMRRLNVALIDIGAGTSDIAISKDGTVSAYGMVPVAGDEITEVISDEYLLDFKDAERAKQEVVHEKSAKVCDILGFETEMVYNTLVEQISERTDHLVQLLGDEVLRLNGNVPKAIMLIGGGSLTPNIEDKLANYLHLPKNRVAIRRTKEIAFLDEANQKTLPDGPEFVTPIGIAISAIKNPLYYTTAYVNDRLILMFRVNALTVGDCLVQAGVDIHQYYGKIGLAKIIQWNDSMVTLRGSYGKEPTIYLNGKDATVNDSIQPEDQIDIIKGLNGTSPNLSIKDLIGERKQVIRFYFHDQEQVLQTIYLVNGEPKDNTYILLDNDRLKEYSPQTIQEFIEYTDPTLMPEEQQDFKVIVNDRTISVAQGNPRFFLNGKPADWTTIIQHRDTLTMEPPGNVTVTTLLQQLHKQLFHTITITFQDTPVTLSQKTTFVYRDHEELGKDSTIHAADKLIIKEDTRRPFIFQDVFRHIDLDFIGKGTTYELTINELSAGFQDEIHQGDQLNIIWAS